MERKALIGLVLPRCKSQVRNVEGSGMFPGISLLPSLGAVSIEETGKKQGNKLKSPDVLLSTLFWM